MSPAAAADESTMPTASTYYIKSIHNPEDEEDIKRYMEKENHGPINPLHDIPLFADEKNGIYNMVVEIPRWTNAKLELKTAEELAPIVQDEKKGKKRYVQNVYPYKGYIWNYGCFPQTWEDPTQVHMETGALGDGDPLDVCEIGQEVATVGQVKQVKVIGVLGMIDEGEMDWKVLVVDVNDRLAKEVRDVNDLYRLMPGLLHATFSWFRTYKVPDGKPLNQFAFREQVQNKKYALDVIEECHHSWKRLVKGVITHKNHNCLNTTIKDSKFYVTPEKASEIIKATEAQFGAKGKALRKAASGSLHDLRVIPVPDLLEETPFEPVIQTKAPMMSIKRFSTELQRKFPHGSNDLSLLISELGIAFKCIRSEICDTPNMTMSGLTSFANEQIHASLASSGLCCLIFSSLINAAMPLEAGYEVGNYIVVYNPMVGDPGTVLGSIFSVYYRKSEKGKIGDSSDLLQREGYEQVAAGYCLFGCSTILTYSMGYGVHSFVLDPISGHFILAKQHHMIPEQGPIYSVNTARINSCVDGVIKYIEHLETNTNKLFRYDNNVVLNFHRVLNAGGIFMLPGPNSNNLAEFLGVAAPLGFIARQAGGRASVGKRPLLELSAWSLEMSVPMFVGSNKDIDELETFVVGAPVPEQNRVDPSLLMKFEF